MVYKCLVVFTTVLSAVCLELNNQLLIYVNSEEIPEIDIEELENAMRQMKNSRAAGGDNILPAILKECYMKTKKELVKLFNNWKTLEELSCYIEIEKTTKYSIH